MKRGAKIAIGTTAGVVALIVIAAAWPKKPVDVEVATVERGTLEDRVSAAASGDVEPKQRAVIRAETVARITDLPQIAGARVKAGDVLIRFDDRSFAAALSAARVQRETAEHDAETAEALQKKGIITEQALLQARAARDVARANAQVAEANSGRSKVTAPFAGLLSRLPLQAGDSVVVGQSIAEIVEDSTLFVRAAFDEVDAVRIKPGDEAVVRLDAYPDDPLPAKVDRVDPVVGGDTIGGAEVGLPSIATKKDRTVGVRVALAGPAGSNRDPADAVHILVGMSADVEVVLGRHEGVLRVPSAAIFHEKGRQFAYVLVGDRLRRREVESGGSNWEFQEVKSGLAEGDRVLISLEAEGISDGVRAHVRETASKKPRRGVAGR